MEKSNKNVSINFVDGLVKQHAKLVMRKAAIVMDGYGSIEELDELNKKIRKINNTLERINPELYDKTQE